MRALILGAVLACCVTAAEAACPDVSLMQNAARGWIAGQRLPDPLLRRMDDALCGYDSFRGVLEAELGPPVGVKVGFASDDERRQFDVEGPLAGAIFAPMLVQDGARLSLKGSRNPQFQAGLVVTVGANSIMQARSREDVAAALRDVRPYLELPDFAYARGVSPSTVLMATYGGMPWRGVLGGGIAMSDLPDPVADLERMAVELRLNGRIVAEAQGGMLMGHPLDAVLWLIEQRRFDLKRGSIIALGSFASFGPATAGQRIEVDYSLAGKSMDVRVTLTP
ncbi:hydratase [Paracoccus ravus]|uniref:hydratase n=1 Tax=Paracoccus ravus TaxID=2447760 RepID=UPI00106EECC1|nr:hydratase [Paracoccus ravus]